MLIANFTGRSPLGRTTRKWEDNLEVDLKEISTQNLPEINFEECLGVDRRTILE